LREAALRHLARYATTEARLRAVLARRVDRWRAASLAAGADPDNVTETALSGRDAAGRVVAALVRERLLDDAEFAKSRARLLLRSSRSGANVVRHLTSRGIAPALAREAAASDPARELAAALLLSRRRRLGPFAAPDADPKARLRALGILARAGFTNDVARQALSMSEEDANRQIAQFRNS
jgi:regulatory protein